MTCDTAKRVASTVTGFVLPGIIELPAISSWLGRSISFNPVIGPENMSLMSWESL